jgi:hypothetical protein
MEHQEVLEQLELAAVEPGGFERLMAGDTPAAAAVAAHLAGCETCAGELERLRRAAPLLRDVVRTAPPADLRERVLATVRERGVPRGPAERDGADVVVPAEIGGVESVEPAKTGFARDGSGSKRTSRVLPWVATLAAAIVISVVVTSLVMTAREAERVAGQARAIAGLEAVTAAALAISAETDAQRVELRAVDGSVARGTLLYSPSTTDLVVVATGLAEPPQGQEYRCWVVIDGERMPMGRMYLADELAYWAGEAPELAGVAPGSVFGVSLADIGGAGAQRDPVLLGES